MRFDAENCLGGFWVQSNEAPHNMTQPIENSALAIDTRADYLYVLRDKQLLKVGTGVGEHITIEGRVYHSSTVECFGRMACSKDKLYVYPPTQAAPTEAVLHVYDAQSLIAMPPVKIALPEHKMIRPADVITDGVLLYLVIVIEGEQHPAICVHVVDPEKGTLFCFFNFHSAF